MSQHAQKSKLPQIGCLLMLIGGVLPVAIGKYIAVTGGAAILLDVVRLAFLAGVILLLIGWLRNRRGSH
ncbi:MAG TPA: hypothetical protein VF911_04470 [Thermoanaerobaculia bacterium]|jgi:hypothetical protein